jgi:hypothetical protein
MESDIPLPKSLLFILVFIVLCSSCGKKQGQDSLFLKESHSSLLTPNIEEESILGDLSGQKDTKESVLLKLAKQSDIPVPVGFEPVIHGNPKEHSLDNSQVDLLCFGGEQNLGEVLDFYRRSMDRNGWKIRDVSSNYEGLLICEKIHKHCVVSIRPETSMRKIWSHTMYVYLFIQEQKEEG